MEWNGSIFPMGKSHSWNGMGQFSRWEKSHSWKKITPIRVLFFSKLLSVVIARDILFTDSRSLSPCPKRRRRRGGRIQIRRHIRGGRCGGGAPARGGIRRCCSNHRSRQQYHPTCIR